MRTHNAANPGLFFCKIYFCAVLPKENDGKKKNYTVEHASLY